MGIMNIPGVFRNVINGINAGTYKYDIPLMEAMIEQLQTMVDNLDHAEDTIVQSANKIQNQELLVGDTADALREAMAVSLKKAIGEIREEAREQLEDLKTEVEQIKTTIEKYKSLIN